MATIDYPIQQKIENPEFSFSETFYKWVATVDHKRLGLMYIVTALLFLVIAGLMAAVIRLQLAFPNGHVVDPDTYNRLFTMHGTTMVFLVGMPMVAGFSNYLVPLMIGARDMAFPRLNSFGFWIFLFGGFLLYFSYIGGNGLAGAGSAPDVGWFAYSPLTAKAFSRGASTDYWILGILVAGVGSIASALNVIVTCVSMRCPGMTLSKMPMFVWVMLIDSWLILIALPPLSAAQIMLLIDRFLGGTFFNTQAGGSAVLWQHFFWIFGHPEVYILIFPSFAILSEIIPVFSRKPIFGKAGDGRCCRRHRLYQLGRLGSPHVRGGYVVRGPTPSSLRHPPCWWVFRPVSRFSTGPQPCTAASCVLRRPCFSALRFLLQFLVAGLTGIMLSIAPFDWQLHDSYFRHRAFSFHACGRFGVSESSPESITGSRKQPAGLMNEKAGQAAFLAVFVLGVNRDIHSDALSGLSWECRGAFILMHPIGAGRI